jgi:hypothetical protein
LNNGVGNGGLSIVNANNGLGNGRWNILARISDYISVALTNASSKAFGFSAGA